MAIRFLMSNTLKTGQGCKVYFNIRKKMFSVLQGGRVVARLNSLTLYGCSFKVSERGRQRVLASGCKNVHAYVCGYFIEDGILIPVIRNGQEVTYNPYKYSSFVFKRNKEPIKEAEWIKLSVVNGVPKMEAYE